MKYIKKFFKMLMSIAILVMIVVIFFYTGLLIMTHSLDPGRLDNHTPDYVIAVMMGGIVSMVFIFVAKKIYDIIDEEL